MLLVLVCTGYQAAWPLSACPDSPLNPVLHSHLISPFSLLHFCTRLTPAWPTPTNPPSISNVKLYELLPPTTLHTGQAVRASSLCFQRLNSLCCHDLFSSLSSSVDYELLQRSSSSSFLLYKMGKRTMLLNLCYWMVGRIKWDNVYKVFNSVPETLKELNKCFSSSSSLLIILPSARHKT